MPHLAIDGGTPMRDEYLIFGSPQIGEEEIQETVHTLRTGWLGTGPKTHQFETLFAEYVGNQHAIGLNSCTAGLELALDVLGVGPGDEVITTPMTFTATANVIVHRGATPVFADVDRDTMNIDPIEVAKRITRHTKALLPVHFAGRPCEMDKLSRLAEEACLPVVSDAAHAAETQYGGMRIGELADISVFSFYVTKNIVTGEGGMITTDSDEWCEELRVKSLHGISKDAWKRYSSEGFQPYDTLYAGYKYNMTDMQASLGIHQLARVETNLKVREAHWQHYDEAFADLPEVITPLHQEGIRHARHLYTILLDLDRLTIGRNQFIAALQAENIGVGIHFLALHLHSFYRQLLGHRPGDFPNAEYISERTVSLPLSAKLTDQDVEDVIRAVHKVIEAYRR